VDLDDDKIEEMRTSVRQPEEMGSFMLSKPNEGPSITGPPVLSAEIVKTCLSLRTQSKTDMEKEIFAWIRGVLGNKLDRVTLQSQSDNLSSEKMAKILQRTINHQLLLKSFCWKNVGKIKFINDIAMNF
jgi:lantibiotic modifying enzyme